MVTGVGVPVEGLGKARCKSGLSPNLLVGRRIVTQAGKPMDCIEGFVGRERYKSGFISNLGVKRRVVTRVGVPIEGLQAERSARIPQRNRLVARRRAQDVRVRLPRGLVHAVHVSPERLTAPHAARRNASACTVGLKYVEVKLKDSYS